MEIRNVNASGYPTTLVADWQHNITEDIAVSVWTNVSSELNETIILEAGQDYMWIMKGNFGSSLQLEYKNSNPYPLGIAIVNASGTWGDLVNNGDYRFRMYGTPQLTGITNVTIPCGDNISISANEGSNTWSIYANDTLGNLNSDTQTFTVVYNPSTVELVTPNNLQHTNVQQNFTAQITDDNGIDTATLTIYNSTDDLYNQTTIDFVSDPTYSELGIVVDLNANDTYTWYYNTTNVFSKTNGSEIRTLIFDAEPPILNWDFPVPASNYVTDQASFTVSAWAFDPYLDATNITVYNVSGDEIYNNFVPNITTNISYFNDTFTLDEGDNIIEISARDSLTGSPKIRDILTNSRTFPTDEDEYFLYSLDNGVEIRRITYIINNGGAKVKRSDWGLTISDTLDADGKHLKTDIASDKLNNQNWQYRIDYICVAGCGYMEYLDDRGVDRIVDSNRNSYFNFDDAVVEGWDVQYVQQGDTASVIISYPNKTFYDNLPASYIIDPITGGLNHFSRNETVRLDTTAPTGESGGYDDGGEFGGTTPVNNSYTNVSPTNFTLNVSDDTGIDNITLTIKNESDDIINQTFVDVSGYSPTEIFFGIVYYLWYEGIYKWSYEIYDIVGNLLTTTEARVTYDITPPSGAILYPLNITYPNQAVNLNYTITEINPFNCWYSLDFGVTNVSVTCGQNITGISSVEGTNTWAFAINDSVGYVNQSVVTFIQDTTAPNVTIDSPVTQNYDYNSIELNVSADEPINTWWYSNDSGSTNVTFTPNTTVVYGDANITLIVYANDSVNNIGHRSVNFLVDTTQPILTLDIPNSSTDALPHNISFNYSVTDPNVDVCWYTMNVTEVNGTYTYYPRHSEASAKLMHGITRNESSYWFWYRGQNTSHGQIIETDANGTFLNNFTVVVSASSPPRTSLFYWNRTDGEPDELIVGGNSATGFNTINHYYPNGSFITKYGNADANSFAFSEEQDDILYTIQVSTGSIIRKINLTSRAYQNIGTCNGAKDYFYLNGTDVGTPTEIFIWNGYLYGQYANGNFRAYDYKNLICDGTHYRANQIPYLEMDFEGWVATDNYELYRIDNNLIDSEMLVPRSDYFGSSNAYKIFDGEYILYNQQNTGDILNCSETESSIVVYNEGNYEMTLHAIDILNNSNEEIDSFFVFHHQPAQVSDVETITTEGALVDFNLTINVTYLTDAEAYLVYNGIEYPAPITELGASSYTFQKTLAIPDGTGSSNGTTVYWNWKYSIDGNSYWVSNYTTGNETQTVFSVDIDNCTGYTDQILNFSLFDEETTNTVNGSANPIVELEVEIISWGDETIAWLFEEYYNGTGQVCVPADLLNYSDYRIDITMGFNTDDHVKEFWFLENGTLDQTDNFNSYTSKEINLYDLLTVDSTTFLFEFTNVDGLPVDDAIVHVFRKYIGEGIFREVERSDQDDNGETHVHLVEEDEIYYFMITQYGEIIYTSSTYNAKCLSDPCLIELEAISGITDFETDYDLIDNGTYAFAVNDETRTVTVTFSMDSLSEVNLTVWEYEGNNATYEISPIESDVLTATAGQVQVEVPADYGEKIFFASIHTDDELVTSKWVNLESTGQDVFGTFGVILTAFLIIALVLMAVTEGGLLVIFTIFGLAMAGLLKLMDISWVAFIGIVIAGFIIIIKLSQRRRMN